MRFFHFFLCPSALTVTAAVLGSRQENNANNVDVGGSKTVEGFKTEGLQAMNDAMHKWVDAGHGSHVVTLLSRHGKIVDHAAYGVFDSRAATKTQVKKDSIFRIMSMTKPVVGVAMMMFYEEGKWSLNDLVSEHIPEFAKIQVKVCKPGNETNCTMEPPKTRMTMRQLMSHSAGFGEMLFVPNSPTLADIVPPLVEGGLAFQPGTDWKYGPGADIQGYLIQKWSGKDLSDFLQEKVLQPLGMVDTGFFVDTSKVDRIPPVIRGNDGTTADAATEALLAEFQEYANTKKTTKPTRLDPSGGLYSTAEDYWRFCQMILNGGEFDGKRYLKADTVKRMRTSMLAPEVNVNSKGLKVEGVGFGLDFAVVLDGGVALNGALPSGSVFWGGAYGTWFWIDPVNEISCIGMISNLGTDLEGSNYLREISGKHIYAALNP